jgi:hypothetical protein
MTQEQANRRYLSVLIPATMVFVAASYGIKLADNAAVLPPWALYAAAIVPIAALLGMFWAHWRYMREIDEFLRSIQVKAAFAGLVIVLTIASAWGYLEFYAEVAPLSIYWLNPLYWIVYSIAVVIFTLRSGAVS